jgi:hypothetical protein
MAAIVAGRLTGFELRAFSQHGADGVIAEILARLESTVRSSPSSG